MTLPLDTALRIGIQTIHRRTEPATGPWLPRIDELVSLVELVDRSFYDSLWVGDHISFAVPILDPLLQLAQAAVVSRRLTLGTSVYLLPLRHPAPVAKQAATLDHMTEGRLIFGVGVGGEFPREYEVCGIPREERGARLSEAIPLLRQFWSGEPVTHTGRFYGPFTDVPMRPPSRQVGGPPIWCGGRSDGALRRTGRLADGWLSYVVTPEMYRAGLDKIATAAPATCCSPASTTATSRHSTPLPKHSACATRWTSAAPHSAIAHSDGPIRWRNASASSTPRVYGISCLTCLGPMNNAMNRSPASPPKRCRCCAT
jgi:alkanesulfonate monooxygenase SsuD/methylene tetrahydromethanopterin reductase-like flavin-dependent oxidoreductase (luciferase family)